MINDEATMNRAYRHALLGGLYILLSMLLISPPTASTSRATSRTINAQPTLNTNGSSIFEPIASIEGHVTAIAIGGALAYMGAGGSLVVLDISKPAQPNRLARLELGGGEIVDLQLVGERLYLTTADGALRIVGIHDPSQPALLGTHYLDIFRVQVIGNLAYTIAQGYSIQVFDVSDPLNLSLRSSYAPHSGFYARDMQVANGLAYVASYDAGFQIIDLRDLNHPRRLGQFTDRYFTNIAVAGSRAYLIGQANDSTIYLDTFDVSQPSKLKRLSSLAVKSIRDLYVAGSLVYALGDDGLHIVDVSQPVAPHQIGAYPMDLYDYIYIYHYAYAHYSTIQVANGLAYVAAGDSGFQIIDISKPAQPGLYGRYTTLGSTIDVQVVGKVAYIAAGSYIRIFDISDSARPFQRGSYFLHSEFAPGVPLPVDVRSMEVRGSLAYVFFDFIPTSCCQAGVLGIMDISDPANPVLIGRIGGWGGYNDMQVVGQRAYLTGKFYLNPAPVLVIFDISNPTAPTALGSYGGQLDTPEIEDRNGAAAVDVAGSFAYVADNSAGLKIIDVSDPVSPTLRSVFDTPGNANDIQVAAGLAYIADGDHGLQIVDVANPSSPTLRGSIQIPGDAVGVRVAGSRAYVAVSTSGVVVIDVSDPARPIPLGRYDTPGNARRVDVAGDLIYVADQAEGLQILKQTPLPSASATIPIDGGTLTSPADSTSYTFAPGIFASTVVVTHTVHYADGLPPTGNLAGGHPFDIQARDSVSGELVQPTKPYAITVHYSDTERGPAIAETLALYFWDGSRWVKEPSSIVNSAAHTISATPNHFSTWAVLGEARRIWLPAIHR
jgi:hypothetical protein